jgi:cytidylate kinase
MPLITVSRQYGADGSRVAALVAEALGWPLLDETLVDSVAARLGTPREAVAALDEKPPTLARRLFDVFALATPESAPAAAEPALTEERVLAVTRRVITDAVARGPVVIVGRGAQAMLAARGDALHVFCCAQREALAERVARRLAIDVDTAARRVDETNRQRAQWVRRHFDREWGAPANYHLCLNTGWLGSERAAEQVVAVARRQFGG